MNDEAAPVGMRAVLPQVDRLPGAERQIATAHGDRFRRAGEHRPYVGGHVVGTFGVVLPRVGLGRGLREPSAEIAQHGRVCVLLDHDASRGVLHEDGTKPHPYTARAYYPSNP